MQVVLSARAQELRSTLGSIRASSAPVSPDNAIGRLTRVDAMQAVSVRQALARDHEAELRLVERALRAIADGQYGVCRRCREPIAEARLRARPHALSCVKCVRNHRRREATPTRRVHWHCTPRCRERRRVHCLVSPSPLHCFEVTMSPSRHATPQTEARIGDMLRQLRERQGLSLRTLATRAGFSASLPVSRGPLN
jgi:DnaK suppressor protein